MIFLKKEEYSSRVGLVANPFGESTTRPLTEPDVQISCIRLFRTTSSPSVR